MNRIILVIICIFAVLIHNIYGEDSTKIIEINSKCITSCFFKSLPYSDKYDIITLDIKGRDKINDFDIEFNKFIKIKSVINDFSENGYMRRKILVEPGKEVDFLKRLEEQKLNRKDRDTLRELLDEFDIDDYLIFNQWILTRDFEGKNDFMRDFCAFRAGGKKFKYTDKTIILWFKKFINNEDSQYSKDMFSPILYGMIYFLKSDELMTVFSDDELSVFAENLKKMEKNGSEAFLYKFVHYWQNRDNFNKEKFLKEMQAKDFSVYDTVDFGYQLIIYDILKKDLTLRKKYIDLIKRLEDFFQAECTYWENELILSQ